MAVFVLLALIWALVLVPPALRAHAARQEAFLVSLGSVPAPELPRPAESQSQRVHRRRRIAGGLLVAMAATLVAGLLPTFRVLLVVHLFLVDSFIAYIALLAHIANRAARPHAALTTPARRRRPARVPAPAVFGELGPVAPLG